MKNQQTPPKRSPRTTVAKPVSRVPRPPKAPVSARPVDSNTTRMESASEKPRSYWLAYRWYILGFFGAVIAFAGCAALVQQQLFFGEDYRLFRFINDWPEKISIVFAVFTALGSLGAATVMVAGAFLFKLYQLAWRLALSIVTVSGLLIMLKEIFARSRPELVLSDIHVRVAETSFAFPSAHTAVATVLALTLRTYIPVPLIWQWLIVIVWIGGVGASRVYLGVHTPLDVLAGFALGVGVVCFWRILPKAVNRMLHLT